MQKIGVQERVSDAREAPRSNMFLAAMLHWRAERSPVKVRNMSHHGAMIEGGLIPPCGSEVSLVRGSLVLTARVIWIAPNRCGLQSRSTIDVGEWMNPPGNCAQQRVDEIVHIAKAGAVPIPVSRFAPGRLLDHPRPTLSTQIIGDLSVVAHLIDDLGEDLVSEPSTLAMHATKLQNLDLATQMLAALCEELSAAGGPEDRQLARLEEIRKSCAEALRPPRITA